MAEVRGRDAEESGDLIEVEPSNPAHGGEFVARLDGRVVFVSDAVDGERALARVTDRRHDGFWRAQVVRVVEPSPWRRPHVWPEAEVTRDPSRRPGGAEYGHIALDHQRALKAQVLCDALQRFAGLDRPVTVEAAPGDADSGGSGWRTRVRLHAGPEGFGPYAARSHRVIPVASLPLATETIGRAAPLVRGSGSAGPAGIPWEELAGADTVDVLDDGRGDAVYLCHRPPATRRASRQGRWQTLPAGRRTIVRRVDGLEFETAVGGFWQVHREAAGVLFEAVTHAIGRPDPSAEHLDLYGGVGLFAAALARGGGRVVTVESSPAATSAARRNLAPWPQAAAVCARTETYLAETLHAASGARRARLAAGTVVLDPPRSGAGSQAVGHLTRLHPARIVYVACDPVALARDLRLFAEAGYDLDGIRAFDLFPHTHHLEAVATLLPA